MGIQRHGKALPDAFTIVRSPQLLKLEFVVKCLLSTSAFHGGHLDLHFHFWQWRAARCGGDLNNSNIKDVCVCVCVCVCVWRE